MLKKLMILACLGVFIGALSGCHAEAKNDKGHGVSGTVG
jgi:hypothetical protein